MTIWQVAAGDGSRDYADVFLKFGVILVGPGSEGNYFSNKDTYNNPDSWAHRPFIKALAEELAKGDLVILKRPVGSRWEIVAVGEVISEYLFENVFGDIDGRDLQHCRRIQWKRPISQTIVSSLRRGTLARVNNQQAIDEANQIWANGQQIDATSIPAGPEEISVD